MAFSVLVLVLVQALVFLPQLVLASTLVLLSLPVLQVVWRKHLQYIMSLIFHFFALMTHFFRSGFGGTTAVTFFFALKAFGVKFLEVLN